MEFIRKKSHLLAVPCTDHPLIFLGVLRGVRAWRWWGLGTFLMSPIRDK